MANHPSGTQYDIAHGDQHATVVEVGGGIREYWVGNRPVLDPYPIDAMCDGAHGAVLVPWPNRLGDGRYRFDEVEHHLPLTEPERRNAIHGLVRWRSWDALTHETSQVEMATRLHPMPGYPFALEVRVVYALDDGGLTVTTTATNLGDEPCPYGFGQHPYLSPGDGTIDDCTVQFVAGTRILTDPERQLPSGLESVEGTSFDCRSPRKLGGLVFDDAFTDLERDRDGKAWVRLASPTSGTVECWVDEHHRYVQLYTGDTLAAHRRRRGLAVEPMTCPANALQTGEALRRIEPGRSVTTAWGVRLVP